MDSKQPWKTVNVTRAFQDSRPLFRLGATLAIALLLVAALIAQTTPSIILATTTSTQDSGLLDVLVPRFEKERGIDVKVIAVGRGVSSRVGAPQSRAWTAAPWSGED
jgi:ABC-type tungstate transport system permease subunit